MNDYIMLAVDNSIMFVNTKNVSSFEELVEELREYGVEVEIKGYSPCG